MTMRPWCKSISVLALAAWLVLAGPARADPVLELTEALMDSQGSEASFIGRAFGGDASSPLHFSNDFDFTNLTFRYVLNPRSTYLGRPITLIGVGAFNPATVSYDWSTSGSLGGVPIGGTGSISFSGTTVSGQSMWTIIPSILTWDEEDDGSLFDGASSHTVSYTINGVPIPLLRGTRRDFDDTATGLWTWDEDPVSVGVASYGITSNGSYIPPGGGGQDPFTTIIYPVPEPSTAVLLGLALVIGRARCGRRGNRPF
jgi:hypothetical protein